MPSLEERDEIELSSSSNMNAFNSSSSSSSALERARIGGSKGGGVSLIDEDPTS